MFNTFLVQAIVHKLDKEHGMTESADIQNQIIRQIQEDKHSQADSVDRESVGEKR